MSNAFDKASLVMLPHAYEEGKVYSLKPTDRSGDFTYSRGTDTATRVGEDGYIKKEYANLLTQSNSFDTSPWILSATYYNLTGNQTGYDGSSDAWLLDKLTLDNQYLRNQTLSTDSVWTASIYAKANTAESVMIYVPGGYATFRLTQGGAVVSAGSNSVDTKMEDVGNGWFRCSVTGTGSQSNYYIQPKDATGAYTIGSIYIQDAQVNNGLVAYPYLETTTDPVYGGLTDDMPRLDYSGGATCPSLLLEPQRTNDIAHSEYIKSGANATISYNDTISPEGVENAIKVTLTGTSQAGVATANSYVSVSTTYTQSCYVKKDVGDYFGFGFFQLDMPISNNNYIRWDLSDITLAPAVDGSYTNGKAEDVGNGWIRLSATITTSANSTRSGWKFLGMKSNSFNSSNVGDSFYLYGIQAEPNATYVTSYIPTYGSSQTRGRGFFDSSADFTNFFGNNQGTIYIETDKRLFENYSTNEEFIGFRDDTKNWRIIGSQSIIFIQCVNWGATIAHYPSTTNPTKYLFKWDGSNVSFYIDGSLIGSATQTATFNPNRFGRTGNGVSMNSQEFLKQFTLFPTALSDSECIALTQV